MDYVKKIKRFLVWAHVMFTTSTLKGGRFLFFQRVYFLFNTATLVKQIHKPTGKAYRIYLQKCFDREVIVKNTIGTFSVNPKNDSLTKSITSFEYNHQQWLTAAKNKKVFIDIGANIGFYSILAVTKYEFEHVHAFEPNPETYTRLKKNTHLNDLTDKVTIHPIGLSEARTNGQLTAKSAHTGGSTLVQNAASLFDATLIDVPVNTFDNICNEHNIAIPDIGFIKIDVEGYEYKVLQGMRRILPQLSPDTCLFIEIRTHAQYVRETKELLNACGFTLLTSSPQNNFLYQKIS